MAGDEPIIQPLVRREKEKYRKLTHAEIVEKCFRLAFDIRKHQGAGIGSPPMALLTSKPGARGSTLHGLSGAPPDCAFQEAEQLG